MLIKNPQVIFLLLLSVLYQEANADCDCQNNYYYVPADNHCKALPTSTANANYIPNCTEYTFHERTKVIKCNVCAAKYSLQPDGENSEKTICEQISDPNCLDLKPATPLSTDQQCKTCRSNFYPTTTICFAFPSSSSQGYDPNCSMYQDLAGVPSCSKCKEGYMFKTGRQPCVPMYESFEPQYIDLCKEYSYYNFQYYCFKCQQGYYFSLDKRLCEQERQTEDEGWITNCEEMVLNFPGGTEDPVYSCEKCKNRHYYDDANKLCIPFPTSSTTQGYVGHCSQYSFSADGEDAKILCEGCDTNYYHQDATCKTCPEEFNESRIIQFLILGFIFVVFVGI